MSIDNKKFQYDNQFLDKLIVSMLVDKSFLFKAISLQIDKYIDSEPHEWFSKLIIQFYLEYKTIPSLQVIKFKIQQTAQPLLKQSISKTFVGMMDNFEDGNLDFIKDQSIKFCRFQQLKQAIGKSIDLLQMDDDYQKIYDVINQTRYKGLENNMGSEYVDSYQERHVHSVEKFIQTPWQVVNNAMGGGLKNKKFGVVLAPPGTGKSWFLVNLAAQALRREKNVVYYTLEMDQDEIGLRMDSLLLGESQEYFNSKANVQKGKQIIEKYHGFLRIKEYLPNKTKLIEIENHIKQLHLYQNFKPDLVIIDYADILKKQGKSNNMYSEYGDVYTAIKTMCKQFDVPIWTGSQGNRSSIESEVVLGDGAAHSMGKLQIADFLISISRTHQDKVSDTARFAVVKNRGGRDGMVYNGMVNLDIGKIEMYDNFTQNSVQARAKMDNNSTIIKDKVRERLINLRKENNKEI